MAVHAGLGGGYARDRGSFHGSMAVAAVDTIISDVMLVTELYRLRSRNVLVRRIGRARQPQNADEPKPNQKNSREQTKSRNKIRTAMKNLGHVSVAL